ncbi:MAG: response regulator [Acidobacteriaceae bacterium]
MLDTILFSQGEVQPLPSQFPDGSGAITGRTHVRVLVVDDERLIAVTVASILNANGFEAVEAFSGQEALEKARALQPDIVLTDVLMPHMTGVELGMRLQAELPQARILMFSGQAATSELMRKAHDDGYDFELFPKPIHPDDLLAKLRGLAL